MKPQKRQEMTMIQKRCLNPGSKNLKGISCRTSEKGLQGRPVICTNHTEQESFVSRASEMYHNLPLKRFN
jgi:hypothetical protein